MAESTVDDSTLAGLDRHEQRGPRIQKLARLAHERAPDSLGLRSADRRGHEPCDGVDGVDLGLGHGDRGRFASYPSGSQPYMQASPTAPILIAMTSALIGDDALPSAGAQRMFELTVLDEPIQLPIAPGPFSVPPVLLQPTVAVVDTGADLRIPEISATHPDVYDVRTRTRDVRDANGHGTEMAGSPVRLNGDV